MTDEVQALTDLKTSVDALTRRFDSLTTEVRAQRSWTRRRLLGVVAALLLVAVAILLGGIGLKYSVTEAHCNRTFNNATAQRTSVLSPATVKLNVSLGELIKTLKPPAGTTREQEQAAFNGALTSYYGQLDQYLADVVDNPAPTAPKYIC